MKNHSKIQTFILDVLFEIAGSILIAAATYNVAVYAGFPLAGFSGIALIIYRLTHLPMGAAIIILNIPVIFLCGKRIGKKFLFKTFRCMMISAVFLDYVAPLFPIYNGDRWIATLLTGTLSGIGYAVIYIRGSSTGGLDFITLYIKSLKPHMKLGTITFVLDFCIIVISGLIFKDIDGIVYGLVINLIMATVLDKMILGLNSGNVGLIVTDHGKIIADRIDQISGRGSTILEGRGGFREDAKDVVMVAGSNKDLYQIGKTIKTEFPDSFIIILDSKEVHGEGFHMTRVAGE